MVEPSDSCSGMATTLLESASTKSSQKIREKDVFLFKMYLYRILKLKFRISTQKLSPIPKCKPIQTKIWNKTENDQIFGLSVTKLDIMSY